nr:DUF302 domain-containing protein [Dyella sp. RRB7]
MPRCLPLPRDFRRPAVTSEHTEQDIIRIQIPYGVTEAVEKLEQILHAHDITIFARIDFSGDAGRAGLTMRPEQMLIFGNPKAGTPLMQAEPAAGLDLPLKALLWEDVQGVTWLACNSPDYTVRRHGLPAALAANLAGAVNLLRQLAG